MASQNDIEQATSFLEKHNFKTLVEWFTAEVILNRPEDPLVFLKQCIEEKLELRMGQPYNPENILDYAKDCYAEASKTADESGKLKPREKPRSTGESSNLVALKERLTMLEGILAASREISGQLDPLEATSKIIRHGCQLLNCDRATLYKLDTKANELELMISKGARQIRLPVGQGVAGSVAASGKMTNIPDAYNDGRFNSDHDASSGYKTNTILASPVTDLQGNIVGVLQAINRKADNSTDSEQKGEEHPVFNERDEEILNYLATHAGVALNNATVYQAMQRSQEKVQSLLDIIHAMHNNLGINSLMFTITQRAHTLVEADRCTMFLVDEAAKELWSLQGEVNLRIPMDRGIAGECYSTNKTINIPDAYEDERFNQAVDKKSGYVTKTILCMPCRNNEGKVVGVIQLINRREGVFGPEDEEIMQSFLIIAGPVLAQSQLFTRSENADEECSEFAGKTVTKRVAEVAPQQAAIQEGDEEEDE